MMDAEPCSSTGLNRCEPGDISLIKTRISPIKTRIAIRNLCLTVVYKKRHVRSIIHTCMLIRDVCMPTYILRIRAQRTGQLSLTFLFGGQAVTSIAGGERTMGGWVSVVNASLRNQLEQIVELTIRKNTRKNSCSCCLVVSPTTRYHTTCRRRCCRSGRETK